MSNTHEFRLHETRPRWRGTVVRSILAGVLIGMLAGFVTLLVSILTLWFGEFLMQRVHVDIRVVYRQIAPAIAAIFFALAFVTNFIWERTHPAPVSLLARRTSA